MMDHLSKGPQGPESLDIEMQSCPTSSSDLDLALLSPSFTQASNKDDEPLIRRPVLPPRPSSKSLNKHSSGAIELEPTSSKDLDPPWDNPSSKSSRIAPPKAFKKTHRFLGFDLGYWRQPARHFSIFAILMVVTIVPLYFSVIGYGSQTAYSEPFSHNCYESSDGWTFAGINIRFGAFNYGSAKALDLTWNCRCWGRSSFLILASLMILPRDKLLRQCPKSPENLN